MVLVVTGCAVAGCGGGCDGTPPFFDIDEPQSGFVTTQETVGVDGSADGNDMVIEWTSANGSSGRTAPSTGLCLIVICEHRWGATIPVSIGDQAITFVAKRSGCTSEKSITVTREEEPPQWSWEWLADPLELARRAQ